MWCLGNEMDGPWQLGHRSADDYGKLAAQTAKAMRQLDSELELVVCGSSARDMPTFGAGERTVLAHSYDDVDFISCHAYYHEKGGDRGSFLASGVDMDLFIEEVVAAADEVRAARGAEKRIQISFDEWNIWDVDRYHEEDKATGIANWPVSPRILEDRYSVLDGVVFGSLMISLLKHADRVTSASLAQLVNVIAPIMTEPGGPAWRQTTFFPFATTSRLARGEAVRVSLEVPSYETAAFGAVPLVDAVATREAATGASAVFLVNRSQDAAITLTLDAAALGAAALVSAQTLHDADPDAANTLENPDRVALQPNASALLADGVLTIELPPISWTAIELSR
jgi:alpha-N-arabinofuranosidase